MRAPTVRPRGTSLAIVLATLVCLLAWGRLGAVGLTQPPRWRDDLAAQGFDCRLNAFDRDGLIYRSCYRGEQGTYLVAFDPARQIVTAQWLLPANFYASRWFDALAVDPAGGLTLLSDDPASVARLGDSGGVEALPAPPVAESIYGFGWQAGRLGIVSAQFDPTGGVLQHSVYEPGAGWSALAPLPSPDCGADAACAPLVATPTQEGWVSYYARAPRRPATSEQIAAEILRVGPDGATTIVQSVTLTAASRAYAIEDGQLLWSSRFADRSGGNVLNYGGRPVLHQRSDGTFTSLPPLPADLFQRDPTEGGAAYQSPYVPAADNLGASYGIGPTRLTWHPTFSASGYVGNSERAILLDGRWIVVHDDERGVWLEERATDADATSVRRGPLVLGRQAKLLNLSNYSAPLLPTPDGGYWLTGRHGETLAIGPDLQRRDVPGLLARFGFLFTDFSGPYDDNLHTDATWLKRLALGWPLFALPLLALGLVVRGRLDRADAAERGGRWRDAALLYLALALLSAPWFWQISAFF